MSLLRRAAMYVDFARGLRRYLKTTIPRERAWQITEQQLASREENLLEFARTAIYPYARSPYRRLLEHAGCTFGDLAKLVRADGVEAALRRLRDEGVYISTEEFKGRQEVRRGGLSLPVSESDFDNPLTSGQLESSTGATRGAGTRTVYDLDYLAEKWAVNMILRYDAYGELNSPIGIWLPIMPGAGPVVVLAYLKAGMGPLRWFSPVDSRAFGPALKNRLGTWYIVHAGRLFGAPMPTPEYVPLDDAERIARWMSSTLRATGRCCMAAYVSAATRISRAAVRCGLDLTGAMFSVSSEPFTERKKQEIEACGARVYSMYAFMEAGIVGLACSSPTAADDNHVLQDSVAIIQRRRTAPATDIEVDALLFTTLLRSSPKVLFNTESGDFGELEERSCDCRLGELGLSTHVHTIRGFDKLTGEGMSFVGTDVVRIVDDLLPTRFGGGATDYQFLEEEDADGRTRLTLLIHPDVGPIDEAAVVKEVLSELSRGADFRRMMATIWRNAEVVRIVREPPRSTARGKVLPLHLGRGM